jgi:hypothetical protein
MHSNGAGEKLAGHQTIAGGKRLQILAGKRVITIDLVASGQAGSYWLR